VLALWDHAGVANRDHTPGGAPPHPEDRDRVALRIPADPDYAAIARTAAMALGLRAGYTWATLTALAVAVDESLILLLADQHHAPAPGTVDIAATVGNGHLELTVSLTGAAGSPSPEAIERFGTLVGDAVDHWTLDTEHHRITLVVERAADGEPPAGT
jgi:hypothetical protein